MSQVISIDIKKLTAYLEANVEGFVGPITLEKFPGGQSNPTFKVTAQSGHYVLRSQPLGKLLKSAHAVDREYQVLDALKETNVPVAKVFHLCTDVEIIGAMFYLMEFCDGSVYWSASLAEIVMNELKNEKERNLMAELLFNKIDVNNNMVIDEINLNPANKVIQFKK